MPFDMPKIMGVVNVTPDSFSDGGRFFQTEAAVAHGLRMVDEGADILDIGGESSRPGAEPVTPEEELKRVIPVIEQIRRESQVTLSIDTYKAEVARRALEAGADIVNDISALRFDPAMATTLAPQTCPVILMHMKGTPRDMQKEPQYDDCIAELIQFFEERIAFCESQGIARARLWLDPGIGFGKRLEDNLAILKHLARFGSLGLPVVIGVSRKSFIGRLDSGADGPEARLGGSLAAAVLAVRNGARVVRVHDVSPTRQALKTAQAIENAP